MNTLEGQFLVAMPDMEDERFVESVILLVGHGEEGAMGLVVNHELANLRFADILDELDLGDPDAVIRLPDSIRQRAVMRGGPVEKGRGFMLHSSDYQSGNTYPVTSGISLTATVDILKADKVEEIVPRLRAAAAQIPDSQRDLAPDVARRL